MSGRPARAGAAAAFAACVLAGCSSHSNLAVQNLPPSSHTESTSKSTTTSMNATAAAEQQALQQYAAFWNHVTVASAATGAATKRGLLAPYAADPELTSMVTALQQQNQKGEVAYGTDVLHPEIVSFSLSRGIAAIRDCQDSSHAGVEAAATRKPLTVGPARNPVNTTLHLVGGKWRVVFVQNPGGTC